MDAGARSDSSLVRRRFAEPVEDDDVEESRLLCREFEEFEDDESECFARSRGRRRLVRSRPRFSDESTEDVALGGAACGRVLPPRESIES